VSPLVVKTELEVPETVNRGLPMDSTNDNANMMLQCDVLVAGAF
jgi:hypothetical protein